MVTSILEVGELRRCGLKVHTCNQWINKSWSSTAQHSDYSHQYCIINYKDAKRLDRSILRGIFLKGKEAYSWIKENNRSMPHTGSLKISTRCTRLWKDWVNREERMKRVKWRYLKNSKNITMNNYMLLHFKPWIKHFCKNVKCSHWR